MTITAERETVTTAPVFALTMPAGEFVAALRNVAPFASTDTTLPVLCGVNVELSADGTLTTVATDRYVLAMQSIELAPTDHASYSGEGSVFLDAGAVKTLGAVKVRQAYELITITLGADGTLTVALPDTRVMTWPARHGEFPNWRNLISGFTPMPAGEVPGTIAYNPAFLAKFAKVKTGEPKITLTPGSTKATRIGADACTISRVECGAVTAWIMHIRQAA